MPSLILTKLVHEKELHWVIHITTTFKQKCVQLKASLLQFMWLHIQISRIASKFKIALHHVHVHINRKHGNTNLSLAQHQKRINIKKWEWTSNNDILWVEAIPQKNSTERAFYTSQQTTQLLGYKWRVLWTLIISEKCPRMDNCLDESF